MKYNLPSPAKNRTTQPVAAGVGEEVMQVRGLVIQISSRGRSYNVVDGATFELCAGKTLGLVGESGSGKTLTGLATLGLLPPVATVTGGSIKLNGTELTALTRRQLNGFRGRQIAMIFQEPRRSLDPSFSVGFQVAEVIRKHTNVTRRQASREAVAMLDRVRIPNAAERAKDYPHQFSGGMCQRVMLAIALACRPGVLIADEPTTALDVTVQAAVLKLIAELQAEMNLAVLLITHDLGVVAEMCDEVAVMYSGQVVERAETTQLFRQPRHPYTEGLQNSVPDPDNPRSGIAFIPGVVPPAYEWPQGCRFHPRCPHAQPGCAKTDPSLVTLDGDRLSRCLRVSELYGDGR